MNNKGISITVTLFSILILAWYLSWLWMGDIVWWLVFLNRGVPYLFIPVLPLLAWVVFTRRLKLGIPLLVPIVIFGWLYSPYLFPQWTRSASRKTELRVMTYNVLFSNSDYAAVSAVVLEQLPDLVALQEVQPDMMRALQKRLAKEYPYSLMGSENDYGTTAVFSRHPIEAAEEWDLDADRPAVAVRLRIHDQPVVFVSVHLLAYNLWWTRLRDIPEVTMQQTTDQNRQARILLELLEQESGIVLVGCDCNSYETSSSYRLLAEYLNNSAREVGRSTQLRSEREDLTPDTALQHIDYVWYRGPLEPLHVFKVNDSGGSDHLPVLAIFQWK
jgi:endonuclease/exonuclease/phosphatase (EEP) superfamily protein YafD